MDGGNMAKFRARYGLTSDEINSICVGTWQKLDLLREGDWACFDDFILWTAQVGWARKCKLKKRSKWKRHGPANSYWEPADEMQSLYPAVSPCRSCEKEPSCGVVCAERLAYWDRHMEAIQKKMGVDNGNDTE